MWNPVQHQLIGQVRFDDQRIGQHHEFTVPIQHRTVGAVPT